LLFDFEPKPMGVIRSADIVGSDTSVRLGQHDGKRARDTGVLDLALQERFLFLVEVEHGDDFGRAEPQL